MDHSVAQPRLGQVAQNVMHFLRHGIAFQARLGVDLIPKFARVAEPGGRPLPQHRILLGQHEGPTPFGQGILIPFRVALQASSGSSVRCSSSIARQTLVARRTRSIG